MKSKIFKKLIAGIATLAMIAQFGFVLPASAATYSTQDFEDGATTGWTVGGGKLTVETASYNKYLQHVPDNTNGNRSAYYDFSADVQSKTNCVVEFDYKYAPAGDRDGELALVGKGVSKPATNNPTAGGEALRFDIPQNATKLKINGDYTTQNYAKDTWTKVRAGFDFEAHTMVLSIKSLDGNTTYFNNKINIDTSITGVGYIWLLAPRGSSNQCLDNITVRDEEDGDFDTFYKVTYTGGLADETEYVKSDMLPANVPANPMKMGAYKFKGTWYKDGDKTAEYTTEEVKAMTLTADTTFEAIFEEDPSAIEKLKSMSIKTHPVIQPELPTKNADGIDNSVTYPVELELTGEWGNDLTDPDYEYTKGDLTVTWDIAGLNILNGESTGEPTTNADGDLVYGDSYVVLHGFTDNATQGSIKITSGVGNYFAILKVKVKYGNEVAGFVEKEDSFPLIIMPNTTQVANRIYPLGGYPVNMNWYADGIVGHKAYDFSNNTQNPDPFLSGWCTWGGRDTKETSLQQDETTGDKYIYSTGGTARNSSVYSAFKMGNVGEQAYVDMDVQFSATNEAIQFKDLGGKNSDYTGSLNNSAFTAIHTTPYQNSISFNGSALNFNGASVTGLEAGAWYRMRISFDDSTQKLWYQVNVLNADGTIGELKGKTDPTAYDMSQTKEPLELSYFVLAPAETGGIKVKNLEIYKPTMTSMIVNSNTETVTIPEEDPIETTDINSDENAVSVTSGLTSITVNVNNKTDESETADAFVACYDSEGNLVKVLKKSATVASNATKPIVVDIPAASNIASKTLFVWSDMKPLIEAQTFELSSTAKGDGIAELTAIMKDAEGNNLSGTVEWSLKANYDGVTVAADPTDSTKAVVTVTGSADPGEITVVASNRGETAECQLQLTGSADNVSFVDPNTSITIPFDSTPATAVYTAEVRTGTGEVIEDKAITYAMYDANNAEPLANTDAVSFDPDTRTLSVTSNATGQVVYIRAASTNTDGDAISKSVKVTIHGLSFDFGASEDEDVEVGYTAVTPATTYSADRGYGMAGTATAGGSASADVLNGDYIESTGNMTFKVNVPRGRNYKITVNYKGALSTEQIDTDCSGVTRTTNESLTSQSYNVAVIDDVLDFTVSNGQLASVEIEMLEAKTAGSKPTWFTYGDSTTNSSSNGKISWANRVQSYTTKFNVNNTAKSGSNPSTFYNGGYMDNILLNIAPGDLVTFNGMGTNSYTGNFESEVRTLIKACRDRGAYVIMTTYTPHGPVGNYSGGYNASTQKFNTARDGDGYTAIYRKIASEDGEVLLDYGKIANDRMNELVDEASTTDAELRAAKAQEIIADFQDHNHYQDMLANVFAAVFAPVTEEAYDALVAADAATE